MRGDELLLVAGQVRRWPRREIRSYVASEVGHWSARLRCRRAVHSRIWGTRSPRCDQSTTTHFRSVLRHIEPLHRRLVGTSSSSRLPPPADAPRIDIVHSDATVHCHLPCCAPPSTQPPVSVLVPAICRKFRLPILRALVRSLQDPRYRCRSPTCGHLSVIVRPIASSRELPRCPTRTRLCWRSHPRSRTVRANDPDRLAVLHEHVPSSPLGPREHIASKASHDRAARRYAVEDQSSAARQPQGRGVINASPLLLPARRALRTLGSRAWSYICVPSLVRSIQLALTRSTASHNRRCGPSLARPLYGTASYHVGTCTPASRKRQRSRGGFQLALLPQVYPLPPAAHTNSQARSVEVPTDCHLRAAPHPRTWFFLHRRFGR